MGRRKATLYMASLFVQVTEETNFVLEFEGEAEKGKRRYKCEIVEWPEGGLEAIEARLAKFRMPVIHEGPRSHFWVRSRHLLVALGLASEAFQGLYTFDAPEFWYNTSDDDSHGPEFRVKDLNPASHDRIEFQCSSWGEDGYDEKNRDAFDETLRRSGLCLPNTVLHKKDIFFAELTSDAARKPLETFQALVNLHPTLDDATRRSKEA